MKYEIIEHGKPGEFHRSVNFKLSQHWQLHGPSFMRGENYCQPMTFADGGIVGAAQAEKLREQRDHWQSKYRGLIELNAKLEKERDELKQISVNALSSELKIICENDDLKKDVEHLKIDLHSLKYDYPTNYDKAKKWERNYHERIEYDQELHKQIDELKQKIRDLSRIKDGYVAFVKPAPTEKDIVEKKSHSDWFQGCLKYSNETTKNNKWETSFSFGNDGFFYFKMLDYSNSYVISREDEGLYRLSNCGGEGIFESTTLSMLFHEIEVLINRSCFGIGKKDIVETAEANRWCPNCALVLEKDNVKMQYECPNCLYKETISMNS